MDFDDVINEHRELQRRNARLEPTLPLERYRAEVTCRDDLPFDRQADAADDQTRDLPPAWLAPAEPDPGLWDVPPLFANE